MGPCARFFRRVASHAMRWKVSARVPLDMCSVDARNVGARLQFFRQMRCREKGLFVNCEISPSSAAARASSSSESTSSSSKSGASPHRSLTPHTRRSSMPARRCVVVPASRNPIAKRRRGPRPTSSRCGPHKRVSTRAFGIGNIAQSRFERRGYGVIRRFASKATLGSYVTSSDSLPQNVRARCGPLARVLARDGRAPA